MRKPLFGRRGRRGRLFRSKVGALHDQLRMMDEIRALGIAVDEDYYRSLRQAVA